MVDSVANNALSSLVRQQSKGIAAGLAALKSGNQSTQAIINQLQSGLDEGKASTAQTSATPLTLSSAPLPRGSIVDRLV